MAINEIKKHMFRLNQFITLTLGLISALTLQVQAEMGHVEYVRYFAHPYGFSLLYYSWLFVFGFFQNTQDKHSAYRICLKEIIF